MPSHLFAPDRRRLGWLALHIAVAASGIALIASGVAWPLALLLSLVIGHSFAGMAFVAHETLHGSVVRGTRLRKIFGGIGFGPLAISPTLWIAWHNKVHHGHAGQLGVDPDTCMTLDKYRGSAGLRALSWILPGSKRWIGGLTLFFGLSGQSLSMLLGMRSTLDLSRGERLQVWIETLFAAAVWSALAIALGPVAFFLAFLLPFFLANVVLTSYILTNHALSPLTDVNDPLLNSLSVTTPRIVEVLHLNFGYHVEHHCFPAMSPRHAPLVRDAIRARWPERYQSLPLMSALARIFATARVYKDPVTLIDPRSGREFPVLLPR